MHRKHIRATDATSGVDIDVPTAIWADGQFLIYTGGELFTQFVVQSHNTSTDNAVARWDGTTGHLIQDSTVIIDDAGNVTGVTTVNGTLPGDWVRGPTPAVSTDNAITRWDGTSGRLTQNSTVIVNDTGDITGVTSINTVPVGDFVRGPAAGGSTDNAITRWDSTTGRLVQNSVVFIGDTGAVTGVLTLNTRDVARWTDGPAAGGSTNNATALWDGTTGRLLKNSNVIMDPTTGDITTPGDITPGKVSGIPVGVLVKSGSPTPHPDQSIARWSNGAGNPIEDSPIFVDDSGNLTQVVTITSNSVGATTKFIDDLVYCTTATVTSQAIPRYFGTNGRRITPSPLTVDGTGNIAGVFTINTRDPALWVQGPASATDNAVARFDATTGKLIQNSTVLIDDTGSITGLNYINGYIEGVWVRFSGAFVPSAGDIPVYQNVYPPITVERSTVNIGASNNVTGLGTLNTRTIARWVDGPAAGVSTDNTLAVWDGTSGRLLKNGSSTGIAVDPSTGVITTPVGVLVHSGATHTDNAVVRWDGTGAHTQDSVVFIGDTGALTGVLTINTRDPALWVQGPTSAADNAIARFDATTGKLIQSSFVTIDDSGNVSAAGNYNGVAIAAHAARHLGGGADTLLAAGFTAGDVLTYQGVGSLFGHRTLSNLSFTAGRITARILNLGDGIENFGTAASGTIYVFVLLIPYVVSDSTTLQIKYTLSGGCTTTGVGVQCGNIGMVTTVSGTYGTLTGIPAAGLMIISGSFNGPGDITITANVTGSGINCKDGTALYWQVS